MTETGEYFVLVIHLITDNKLKKVDTHVLILLSLSVPTFFWRFHYLQKIDCNEADFCYRNTNCIPNEKYCPQLFSALVNFEITFERVEKSALDKIKKSAFENFIF